MSRWIVTFVVLLTASFAMSQVIDPVIPADNEEIAVNQAIMVVDSSTSMQANKIKMARQTAQMIAGTMPRGDYKVGLLAFGGREVEASNLMPFSQSNLFTNAGEVPFLGRNTPIASGLDQVAQMLIGTTGQSAVILISDGLQNSGDAMAAAQMLAQRSVCIHTVQIGSNPNGAALLEEMANLTSCGSFQTAESISNPVSMKDFVRKVFLKSKPAEAAIAPPPVKPAEDGDSDGDGVPDSKDECPNTPKGAKVDDRGCWTLPNIMFDLNKADIRPEFYDELDEIVAILKKNPDIRIHIDGHTCSRGTDKYNQTLSEKRAGAVSSYLQQKGIDASRLVPRGYGESQPAYPNNTEASRIKNRRVEFRPIIPANEMVG
jgi:OOP family OmpA-OmpF porin